MSTYSAVHAHPWPALHVGHFHVMDSVRAMLHFLTFSEGSYYPPSLNSVLEDSAMAREMYRL